MVVMVLLMTLAPFRFRVPHRFLIYLNGSWKDMAANVLLFIPLGFLYRLSRRKRGGTLCLREFAFGFLLSATIEAAQLFLPKRYTQVTDVVTNGLGAWAGAKCFDVLRAVIEKNPIKEIFSLELPLINLVYLLVPLLWLNGLAAGPDPTRLWLHALLGLMGMGVLTTIYRHRFAQRGAPSENQLTVFALGWFLVSAFPALMAYPGRMTAIALALGIVARILVSFPGEADDDNRRFESGTLKKLLPLYVLYLLLLPLWPSAMSLRDFQLYLDCEYFTSDERLVGVFRFVELIAALTLLGYLVAELRGRKKETLERTLGWIFGISLPCLFFIHFVREYQAPGYSDIYEFLPLIVASLYGGLIYRLQLDAIRRPSAPSKDTTGLL